MSEIGDAFEEMEAVPAASLDEALVVTVDGFEGPLDLLLALARNQKVDIAKISVLKLADQYLEFIESARGRNLELAADYLVMAAWLAYLKSRLILPQPPSAEGEPTADELATLLRWRLQRLQAMREAAARLMARDRLGREVFAARRAGAGQGHQAHEPHRFALRSADGLCDTADQEVGPPELSAGPAARAADRRGARAAGTHAGPHRQLEHINQSVAVSNGREAIAASFGPCEHASRVPRTGARRQGRDLPDEALRRHLREGSCACVWRPCR